MVVTRLESCSLQSHIFHFLKTRSSQLSTVMASDAAQQTINVLATIATVCIFLSMIPAIWALHKKRNTQGVNFYPLAAMFGQSMGWVLYGWASHAFWPVGAVNLVGAVLGFIFSGVFILHEKEYRSRYTTCFIAVFALVIALLLYRVLGTQTDHTISLVLGYFANAGAIIMFGSPLMLLGTVVKTRSAEMIATPMAIAGLVNGSLWTAYGAMEDDLFVLVPNCASAILCLCQLVLVMIYGCNRAPKTADNQEAFLDKPSVDGVSAVA